MYLQCHSSTVLPPSLSLQNCQISLSFCPLSPSSFIRALFIQHIIVCLPSFSPQNYISGKALQFLYHGYDWRFSIRAKQNVGSSSLLQSFVNSLLQKKTILDFLILTSTQASNRLSRRLFFNSMKCVLCEKYKPYNFIVKFHCGIC